MTYKTELLKLDFQSLEVEIERVTNIDELYDALIAKGNNHEDFKDERIPYWAELWASALALSQYIVANKEIFQQKNIIEIGAGLGLPSIVAGYFSDDITITDYLLEAVDFAKLNWERNHKYLATFQQLDWRTPPLSHQFDIVLAADIAYEKRMFEDIPLAFRTLCKPDGIIFLTEPNRGFAKPFIDDLSKHGFEVAREVIPIRLWNINSNINLIKIKLL